MGSFQGGEKYYQDCFESGIKRLIIKRLSLRYVTDWGSGDTEETIMYIKGAESKYRNKVSESEKGTYQLT